MFQPEHSRCFHHPPLNPNHPPPYPLNVPTGTFEQNFPRSEPMTKPLECSGWNIGHVLHINQPTHGNSTLHSKRESHYSANSSGFSTIYGTRHRCCQSEGRRG